ncbi:vWA domain-containing protein [Rhodopirellula sp. SWK7]|uniref:vWA domain-containing protein n=1 Tax=Rhodopirellula sp. SWK7 TaxID=595460 RepID=UPI0002BD4F6E|nr:VWA domain-containing protein [Rhodopirellula sp. SWK7]EMI44566.1 von Willebrand factor type A [Rhodopirellula sp. SWK7]
MSQFAFQNPSLLALLLVLIPVGWLMLRARKRREIVRRQMGGSQNPPSFLRDGLRLLALLLLLLAVARPGIFPRRHSVTQSGRDVVFALDVSQSMLAKDAFPSRLEAAKNGIRDALDSFQSERVALVVYAGSANILCPLTHDYEFVRYMLDQATPRAVDFGGTTLLSATEKSVDNVFDSERKGMQDLVVLTDGEEHGDQNKRVAELLQENETGLLIIGIGDSTVGSRIPIESDDGESDDGEPDVLKHDGHVVMTKLNETGLQQLARMSTDATYVSAGTSAFDLAGTYAQYAINKPIAGTAGGETYVVYREVGLLLIGIAIAMLLAAEIAGHLSGKHFPTRKPTSIPSSSLLLITLLSTIGLNTVNAEDTSFTSQFETAARLQNSGKTSEALEAFDTIESQWLASSLTPTQLATIRFNQGLCHVSLAQEQAEAEPRQALSRAQIAQNCFLEACRMNPRFVRAAMRLDPTASLIENYIQLIEEEDEREQQLQEQMQNLLKLLKELEEKQTELRNEIPGRPNQNTRSRRGQSGVEPPPSAPDSASSDAKRFMQTQRSLHDEGSSIRQIMRSIDQSISMQNEAPLSDSEVDDSSQPQPQVSVLEEPLRLMDQVVDAQEQAIGKLQQWNSWPAGRDQQLVAIKKIQEILEMLSSNDSGESDEGEWDEDAEYDEMMEASDSEEAMMSSMQGQGDFASGSSMQPLPVPNYSVEDILMEEQGSLQFRQQQRAKSNQANVEKDW